MQKVFKINLDISKKVITPTFEVNTNDLNSIKLLITITDEHKPLDLTGITPRLPVRKPDNHVVFQDCEVVDAENGQIEVILENQAYVVAGTHTAEVMCYKENALVSVTGTFSYKAKKGIMSDEALESKSEFTAITITLNDVQETIEDMRKNGTGIDTEARKDIEDVTAQLAETGKRLDGISIDIVYPPAPLVGAKPDADFYDETTKKYYKDAAKTIPATNNQPAFQAAVNYLSSKGGGKIEIPHGNYVFRSGVKWASNVSMKGVGMDKSKLFAEGTIFDLFYYLDYNSDGSDANNPAAWLNNCEFEGFKCDLIGLTHAQSSVSGKAFFMLYMKKAKFRNLHLANTIGTALGCDFLVNSVIEGNLIENAGRNFSVGPSDIGQSGIGIGTCATQYEPVTVVNNHIYNCGNYGIFVETQYNPEGIYSDGAIVANNFIKGCKYGIGNKGSGGVLMDVNWIVDSRDIGIFLNQNAKDDTITNNKILRSTNEGIYVWGYKGNLTIQGNEIAYNGRKGIHFVEHTTVTDTIMIKNNNIHDNNMAGINLFGGMKNVSISGNTVKNNCKTVTSYAYAAGIMVEGMTNTSLIQNLNITDNIIVDDLTTKKQLVGIKIRPNINITNGIISTNTFVGTTYNTGFEIDGNAVLTNFKVKNNNGHVTELNGTGTIADTTAFVDITFPESMAKAPNSVLITAHGATQVYPSNITRLGFRANRTGTAGALVFSWESRI